MPHNPKKNAAINPKIAAIMPPPIPGPMYENRWVLLDKVKKIITD